MVFVWVLIGYHLHTASGESIFVLQRQTTWFGAYRSMHWLKVRKNNEKTVNKIAGNVTTDPTDAVCFTLTLFLGCLKEKQRHGKQIGVINFSLILHFCSVNKVSPADGQGG